MKFLFLPTEHDPDSYIRELGAEAFERQVRDAMPLSQFLLNEVTAENDLGTAEGRARAQFDAKPLLQAMPPSSLRLQIVRSLAQLTQTTPTEIEALFELAKPIARERVAPARSKRAPPLDMERQVMRLLVAHPALAAELDETARAALVWLAPDGGAMLMQLIDASREIGPEARFAILAEHLRNSGSDFDALIAEIAAQSETEIDVARLELAGAVRQTKMKILKAEQDQLAASGLLTEEARMRYRELMLQQDQLRREAEAEIAQR
jgi:DNA primase